jgi:peptidoglycan/xylan/chitin deacetylase (PgdA/CDA1 family)
MLSTRGARRIGSALLACALAFGSVRSESADAASPVRTHPSYEQSTYPDDGAVRSGEADASVRQPEEGSSSVPSFKAERKRKRHKRGKRKPSRRQTFSWVTLEKRYPGSFVFGGPRNSRRVALTFDDAPDPRYTPKLLDILARYKVRATFFVVGWRAAEYPALLQRIRREGHIIGNHSYDHAVFSRISHNRFKTEILRTDSIVRRLVGSSPKLVRPPYGEILPKQVEWLRDNGFIVVNWDVDSVDWRSIGSERILLNVKKTLQPGSIILQHAGGGVGQDLSGTVNALPRLIQLLRGKGYRIVTVPELLGRPESRGTS